MACGVPWQCEVCGRTGTIQIPDEEMRTQVGRLRYLIFDSMEQHGLFGACGLFNLRYDFPECWRAVAK